MKEVTDIRELVIAIVIFLMAITIELAFIIDALYK